MPIPVTTLSPARLSKALMFDALPIADPSHRGGKVIIYEKPRNDVEYAIGVDFAYGISGRDRDAACVMGKFSAPGERGYVIRQVAQAWGWWGEKIHRTLYGMCRYYNNALLLGERQCGLGTLRTLYDPSGYNYRRLYFDRLAHKKGKPRTDVLGIHRAKNDVTLSNLVLSVAERRVELVSEELIEEMEKCQWIAPGSEDKGRMGDERLKMRVLSGESADLTMSALYAFHAASCLHLFPPVEDLRGKVYDEHTPQEWHPRQEVKEVYFARRKR